MAQIGAAFTKLFQGDFSGFWKDFSTAAVSAFQKIWQAILQTEGIFGDFARAISGEGVVKTPWVQQLVDGIKEIGKSIPGTIQLIITALIGLGQAASGVANIMNRLFGTELTGTDVAAIAIIGQMTGGLQALSSVAVIAGAAITTLISIIVAIAPAIAGAIGISAGALVAIIFGVIAALIALIAIWPQLKADAVATWEQIKAKAAEVMQLIQDWVLTPVASAWQWIVDTFNSIVGQIAPKVQELKNGLIELVTTPIASAWQWITDTFNAAIDAILGKLASAIAAIKSALAAATSGSGIDMGGGSGGTPGLASGGQVGGRGTGTSDSNLARVSRGEYITPAAAVRQPGVLAFLEALRRSGGDLRNAIERMGHFALGGLVLPPPVAIPAFAGGGMSHVTIQFPGLPDIVGLRASSNVVGELRKAAAMAQVRSGGRKPSRYG